MAIYTSNVSRITGFSGLDTESMIEQLMTAESTKLTKLQQKQQRVTWQQEAYRAQISNINTFRNGFFSSSNPSTNFRMSTAFKNFQSTVMNGSNESSAISVTSNSAAGNYKVQVAQVASKAGIIGSEGITKTLQSSDMTGTNMADNMTNSDTMKVTLDGKTVTLKFDEVNFDALRRMDAEDANQELASIINTKLDNAFGRESGGRTQKVGAEYENGRLTFTTTVGHSISVTETTSRDNESTSMALDKIEFEEEEDEEGTGTGKFVSKDDIRGDFTVDIGGTTYTVTLDIEAGKTADEISDAINSALKRATYTDGSVDDEGELIEKTKDISGSLKSTAAVADEDTGEKSITLKTTNKTQDITVSGLDSYSDSGEDSGSGNVVVLTKTGLLADLGLKTGQNNQISTGSSLADIFGADAVGSLSSITINGQSVFRATDDPATMTLATFMNKINNNSELGVNISFNNINNTFNIEAKETGADSSFDISGDIFKAMNLTENGATTATATGNDAIFSVDGVWTSRASNNIDVNGFKFTINETTTAAGENVDLANLFDKDEAAAESAKLETLTVSSKYDVDTTLDKIKSFVEEYNKLISLMNAATSEKRAKSDSYSYYDPLTDDQKDAMTEKEIEKWEEKAKTGLLYNDNTLKNLASKMRSVMYERIDLGDGTSIALYDIGITTSSDWSKQGELVIDEEKLRNAISERGGDIEKLFTQTGTGLADKLDKIMDGAVGTSGTLRDKAGIENTSSVNENQLSKQIKSLNQQISDMKTYLYNKENQYYKMFSAMEAAMSQNDSQLSLLQSSFS